MERGSAGRGTLGKVTRSALALVFCDTQAAALYSGQAGDSLLQKYDLPWQSQVGGTELCQSIKLAP